MGYGISRGKFMLQQNKSDLVTKAQYGSVYPKHVSSILKEFKILAT